MKKERVEKVKQNSIVRYKGDWGVLIPENYLDRWIGGPLKLRPTDVVEVLPPPKRPLSFPVHGSRRKT